MHFNVFNAAMGGNALVIVTIFKAMPHSFDSSWTRDNTFFLFYFLPLFITFSFALSSIWVQGYSEHDSERCSGRKMNCCHSLSTWNFPGETGETIDQSAFLNTVHHFCLIAWALFSHCIHTWIHLCVSCLGELSLPPSPSTCLYYQYVKLPSYHTQSLHWQPCCYMPQETAK